MTVDRRVILLVLSIICSVLFAFAGFGWISVSHPDGWLGSGLAFLAAALL